MLGWRNTKDNSLLACFVTHDVYEGKFGSAILRVPCRGHLMFDVLFIEVFLIRNLLQRKKFL